VSTTLRSTGGYVYNDADLNPSHGYLLPTVCRALAQVPWHGPMRLFELGCGNGSVASLLSSQGYEVVGIDASVEGIQQANSRYPTIRLELGSAYDDLPARYGTFQAVLSLEVVEHLYAPREFAANVFRLLEPGGTAIISTPYHGYLKNLALAATGKFDAHFTALWDHGHIKFWSVRTLGALLLEAGFSDLRFVRVGRIPSLAKSMIVVATRQPT
jgi:SAM-dependent methyltransferase